MIEKVYLNHTLMDMGKEKQYALTTRLWLGMDQSSWHKVIFVPQDIFLVMESPVGFQKQIDE